MKGLSTTARLTLLVFILQFLGIMALLVGVDGYVRWRVAVQAAADGEILREELLAIYGQGGRSALKQAVALRTIERAMPRAVMMLADPSGKALAGNLYGWPAGIDPTDGVVATAMLRTDRHQAEPMRVRVTTLPDGARLLTGIGVQGEDRAIRIFGEASGVALAAAMLFAALIAWVATKLFVARLSPVIHMLEAAQRGDFGHRLVEIDGQDAFATLGRVANTTLDHLDALMADLKLATDSLAHDLKSPITRLRGALERVREEMERDPRDLAASQQAVDRAHAEGDRLLEIVETALSISRAEAGIGREAFQPVDLSTVLVDLAEIYGPVVEEDARSMILQLANDVPDIEVHRELIGQAMSNLIDNALKYGRGTITLGLSHQSDMTILSVADEGEGIPQQDHAAAVRRFGRLNASRTGSGAGLGLSLADAVAKLHGGELRLHDGNPGLRVTIGIRDRTLPPD